MKNKAPNLREITPPQCCDSCIHLQYLKQISEWRCGKHPEDTKTYQMNHLLIRLTVCDDYTSEFHQAVQELADHNDAILDMQDLDPVYWTKSKNGEIILTTEGMQFLKECRENAARGNHD